jgi:putative Mg2+ transporter-C (MgtC) family protein
MSTFAGMNISELALSDQLVVAARTGIAALLGAVVGIERWHSGKEAGMRTHALVAAAAALAVGLGEIVLGGADGDAVRTLHAVLTGIGFIGAGAILHSEGRTSGLTTAASVFNVAVIGAAVGLGAIVLGALGALASLAVLQVFGRARSFMSRFSFFAPVSTGNDTDFD